MYKLLKRNVDVMAMLIRYEFEPGADAEKRQGQ